MESENAGKSRSVLQKERRGQPVWAVGDATESQLEMWRRHA